jgi:hypothetical protein
LKIKNVLGSLSGSLFYGIYLLMGLIQLASILGGIENWWGWPWWIAIFVATPLAYIPILGTILGIMGAIKSWGWMPLNAVLFYLWPLAAFLLYWVGGMIYFAFGGLIWKFLHRGEEGSVKQVERPGDAHEDASDLKRSALVNEREILTLIDGISNQLGSKLNEISAGPRKAGSSQQIVDSLNLFVQQKCLLLAFGITMMKRSDGNVDYLKSGEFRRVNSFVAKRWGALEDQIHGILIVLELSREDKRPISFRAGMIIAEEELIKHRPALIEAIQSFSHSSKDGSTDSINQWPERFLLDWFSGAGGPDWKGDSEGAIAMRETRVQQ